MKQMRSRFRLITMLLVCGFLLALVACTGSALKTAGVSLSGLPVLGGTVPVPSASPASPPAESSSPEPSEIPADSSIPPVTDIFTNREYNVAGS